MSHLAPLVPPILASGAQRGERRRPPHGALGKPADAAKLTEAVAAFVGRVAEVRRREARSA